MSVTQALLGNVFTPRIANANASSISKDLNIGQNPFTSNQNNKILPFAGRFDDSLKTAIEENSVLKNLPLSKLNLDNSLKLNNLSSLNIDSYIEQLSDLYGHLSQSDTSVNISSEQLDMLEELIMDSLSFIENIVQPISNSDIYNPSSFRINKDTASLVNNNLQIISGVTKENDIPNHKIGMMNEILSNISNQHSQDQDILMSLNNRIENITELTKDLNIDLSLPFEKHISAMNDIQKIIKQAAIKEDFSQKLANSGMVMVSPKMIEGVNQSATYKLNSTSKETVSLQHAKNLVNFDIENDNKDFGIKEYFDKYPLNIDNETMMLPETSLEQKNETLSEYNTDIVSLASNTVNSQSNLNMNSENILLQPKQLPIINTEILTSNSENVQFEIKNLQLMSGANDGATQITIQLYPEELGRIEVQIQAMGSNNLQNSMTIMAENTQTLELLQLNIPELERSLSDLNIRFSDNAIKFELADQASSNLEQQNNSSQEENSQQKYTGSYNSKSSNGEDDAFAELLMPFENSPNFHTYRGNLNIIQGIRTFI